MWPVILGVIADVALTLSEHVVSNVPVHFDFRKQPEKYSGNLQEENCRDPENSLGGGGGADPYLARGLGR